MKSSRRTLTNLVELKTRALEGRLKTLQQRLEQTDATIANLRIEIAALRQRAGNCSALELKHAGLYQRHVSIQLTQALSQRQQIGLEMEALKHEMRRMLNARQHF